jgi:thiosulfate/3-mercaptopyruvate sulfurtransferase
MIETFYETNALGTPAAFVAALAIGAAFGFLLERAGFGSSRKLAGVFYFRDMTVVKVMFSALLTAMIGLGLLRGLGVVGPGQLHVLETAFGGQIVGGLIFGVGFVVGGWCPGTAAAGVGAGKVDALAFLFGGTIGAVVFNEAFPLVKPLYEAGRVGASTAYGALGISYPVFAGLFTLAAVACFWACEFVERIAGGSGTYLGSRFLKAFSVALLLGAAALFAVPAPTETGAGVAIPSAQASGAAPERALLAAVDAGEDHLEPEELADRLLAGDPDLLVVDVRPAAEYEAFHLPGAVNIALADLPAALAPHRGKARIVLYSNGMTHPAQARDALQRLGFRNVFMLTDGLDGFISRCLKPVSLRPAPLPEAEARRVQAWRARFLGPPTAPAAPPAAVPGADAPPLDRPGLVDTAWLAHRLGRPDVKPVDLRPQPEYNMSHVPGALSLQVESLRGNVGGIPSMLLPAPVLAAHVSQMGLRPDDTVVLMAGDKMQDATLAALALERIGHRRVAVLDGGFPKWAAEKRPVGTALPAVTPSAYPAAGPDAFTVGAADVLARKSGTTVLDVRPAENYTGAKSDEPRAGHIPGAINRPYTADVEKKDGATVLKPVAALEAEYARLLPDRDAPVIVHCRTGHQASQTWFVLKHLLGYRNVRWYDASWTEWSARPELPVEK